MYAYCPDCETELDQASGICPACRWDPVMAATQHHARPQEPEISLSQRYRGTEYDLRAQYVASQQHPAVSRGRAFVIAGLAAGAGLYAIAMGVLGVF